MENMLDFGQRKLRTGPLAISEHTGRHSLQCNHLQKCGLEPLLEVDVVMEVVRPNASSIVHSFLGQDCSWDAPYAGPLLACSRAWRAGF